MGTAMCFFVEYFLKVFGSGQADVRSGTSMTTHCMVNANMASGSGQSILHDKTWIFLPLDSLLIAPDHERCLELSNWMSVYKMFAFTTHHVVIEVPERMSDCPVSKPFKNFPPPPKKNPRNTHDEGMR